MFKLYIIKCFRAGDGGYIGDETIPTQSGFNIRFVNDADIHKSDSGLVMFFSPAQAQAVRDELMETAELVHPGHGATITVESDMFDPDEVDALMKKTYRFQCEIE